MFRFSFCFSVCWFVFLFCYKLVLISFLSSKTLRLESLITITKSIRQINWDGSWHASPPSTNRITKTKQETSKHSNHHFVRPYSLLLSHLVRFNSLELEFLFHFALTTILLWWCSMAHRARILILLFCHLSIIFLFFSIYVNFFFKKTNN